ncbi:MAG: nitrilase-related carbon-nitrogen hydrolase [Gammaproteobacteria bacterium]
MAAPERCTLDYSDDSFIVLADLAEREQGESFRALSALASQIGVAISFSTAIQDSNRYFASNITNARNGKLLSRYDKVHLPQLSASHEADYFASGHSFGPLNSRDFDLA